MVESNNFSKKQKRGKITNSILRSFFIVFIAGASLSISTTLHESFREAAIVIMLIASGLFIWSILREAKSAIATEERIDALEKRIMILESS